MSSIISPQEEASLLALCEMGAAQDAALAALGDPASGRLDYPDPPAAPAIVNLSATYQWNSRSSGYTGNKIFIEWPQRLSYSCYQADKRPAGGERWLSENTAIEQPAGGRRRLAVAGIRRLSPPLSYDVRIRELPLGDPSDYAYARLDFPGDIFTAVQLEPNAARALARTADSLLIWCISSRNLNLNHGLQLSAIVGRKTYRGEISTDMRRDAYLFIDGLTADTRYNFPLSVKTGTLSGDPPSFAPGAATAQVSIDTYTLPAAGPLTRQ